MNLEYYNNLDNLIQNQATESEFIKLYKKFFGEEPNENLIANYITNINNVTTYREESSYDDDYYDSY